MITMTDVKANFPVLSTQMNGHSLVYLDNGATTQKPDVVIRTMAEFYSHSYATIHRGVYRLSQESTDRYEEVRTQVAKFLKAKHREEIIFVRGTTEAINLVAYSFGETFIQAGDEILLPEIEHHANLVPWQVLAARRGATLRFIPVNDAGELQLEVFESLLSSKTKLVALAHISNVLGTIHPIKKIIEQSHKVGAKVLIDGAQGISHLPVNVQDLDCDFYCFSGHKLYGPTGVGVLYGRKELLEKMTPYQTGGDMIESVSLEKTDYAKIPSKFEAGTPAIAEVLGIGAAIQYLSELGFGFIQQHESQLLEEATNTLSKMPGLRIIGTAKQKASLISFVMDGIHPHDIGTILDSKGIAIRAGHHCSQPTMKRFGVPATARASFAFYNTTEDIDRLVTALQEARKIFG